MTRVSLRWPAAVAVAAATMTTATHVVWPPIAVVLAFLATLTTLWIWRPE